MPRSHRRLRTVEELTEGILRRKLVMKQNQEKLLTGEVTEEELAESARVEAEATFRKTVEGRAREIRPGDNISLAPNEIDKYRQELMSNYEQAFEWNDTSDQATLTNLVELEVQLWVLRYELQRPALSASARKDHLDSLTKLIPKHSELLGKLGIDRKTRENARITKSPMEKFEDQMRRADAWMKQLVDNFPQEAQNVVEERDLRELMKSTFGFDFVLVDAIIGNVKRINGLDPAVEAYD